MIRRVWKIPWFIKRPYWVKCQNLDVLPLLPKAVVAYVSLRLVSWQSICPLIPDPRDIGWTLHDLKYINCVPMVSCSKRKRRTSGWNSWTYLPVSLNLVYKCQGIVFKRTVILIKISNNISEEALSNPVNLLLSQLPFLLSSIFNLSTSLVVLRQKHCQVSYQTCILLMKSFQQHV